MILLQQWVGLLRTKMIKTTKLHSEFTRRFNRINSGSQRFISPPEIDLFLNEALEIFFENRVALYKTSDLAREELGPLEEKNICFTCQKFDSRSDYFTLPEKFYKLLRVEAFIKCDDCPELAAHTQIITNHDIAEALTDPNWKPSYNYKETFAEMSGDKIITYHNNAFDITKVCIDYIRRPNRIYAPSLSFNGSYIDGSGDIISVDSDLELKTDRKIVDLAVLIASRDILDVEEFQTQLEKILQTERIYIS